MQLRPNRFDRAEQKRTVYAIDPEHGTTVEDMLKPAYWAHVAAKLRPSDRIEALAEDGSWMAVFHVVAQGPNWAKVVLMPGFPYEFEAKDIPAEIDMTGHRIEWAGRHAQFRVVRLGKTPAENVTLRDKLYPKSEAAKWLADHLAVINKPSRAA